MRGLRSRCGPGKTVQACRGAHLLPNLNRPANTRRSKSARGLLRGKRLVSDTLPRYRIHPPAGCGASDLLSLPERARAWAGLAGRRCRYSTRGPVRLPAAASCVHAGARRGLSQPLTRSRGQNAPESLSESKPSCHFYRDCQAGTGPARARSLAHYSSPATERGDESHYRMPPASTGGRTCRQGDRLRAGFRAGSCKAANHDRSYGRHYY